MKIRIVGAGAIGGVTRAHLIRAGSDVTFADSLGRTVECVAEACAHALLD